MNKTYDSRLWTVHNVSASFWFCRPNGLLLSSSPQIHWGLSCHSTGHGVQISYSAPLANSENAMQSVILSKYLWQKQWLTHDYSYLMLQLNFMIKLYVFCYLPDSFYKIMLHKWLALLEIRYPLVICTTCTPDVNVLQQGRKTNNRTMFHFLLKKMLQSKQCVRCMILDGYKGGRREEFLKFLKHN